MTRGCSQLERAEESDIVRVKLGDEADEEGGQRRADTGREGWGQIKANGWPNYGLVGRTAIW